VEKVAEILVDEGVMSVVVELVMVGKDRVYYNENDSFCCEWLWHLMEAGVLPGGEIDCRPIQEVTSNDVKGFKQCHWFCGIGGWPYALQQAVWPLDRPIWTGSAPCQPFSCAGKHGGEKDERHLWPEFFRLIGECRPECVFGEQVASKDGLGWLDGVFSDLEGAGYACGAADLCASGVGAPHVRQRLWWVATLPGDTQRDHPMESGIGDTSDTGGLEHAESQRCRKTGLPVGGQAERAGECRPTGGPADAECDAGWLDQPERETQGGVTDGRTGPWSDFLLVPCRDGKVRRIGAQSGDEPLVAGIPRDLRPLCATLEGMGYSAKEARRMLGRPRSLLALAGKNRVGRLKGYGNSLCIPVAVEFITAYLEILNRNS